MPQPPKKQNWLRDLAPRDATKTKVDAKQDAAERARRALDAATRRMPAAPTMRANTKTDRLAADLARQQQKQTQAQAELMMNPVVSGATFTPGADAADAITNTLSSVRNFAKGNKKQGAKDAGWAALAALGVSEIGKMSKAEREAVAAAEAAKRRLGLPERFVVLTPDNPMGNVASDVDNLLAQSRFEARLKELGIDYHVGVGGYPGEGGSPLRERSYALKNTDIDTAKQLGREFNQAGILSERGYHNLSDNTIYPSRGIQPGDDDVFTRIPGFGDDAEKGFKLDLDWDAKQPDAPISEWTPEMLDAYGAQHGVEGLGRVSPPTEITLANGKKANIPGGFDGDWSYYDLLTLKAQGINPNDMPREMHDAFQEKLGRSMQVADGGDDTNVFRGLLLGITSPNNPLTPNEFGVSALMPRNMEDIEKLSQMTGPEIVEQFKLNAGSKGGLGTSGSADYNNVANLARLFVQKPEWFRRRVNEDWSQFVERLSSQVKGLSPKTASFGAVWQDILNADISAIDRHMSDVFYKDIMNDPATRSAFEEKVLDAFNKGETEWGGDVRPQVSSIDELRRVPGGESAFKEAMMKVITQHSDKKLKGKNAGSLPPHLRDEQWIEDPDKVVIGGDAWRRALDANRKDAQDHGLSTFLSQWLLWDRMRGRLEPHEVMYPGLNKLPRMTHEQRKAAYDVHRAAGYTAAPPKAGRNNANGGGIDSEGGMLAPVRGVKNPMSMAYWSALAAAGLGGVLGPDDDPESP